jgi:Peptidase M50B-like
VSFWGFLTGDHTPTTRSGGRQLSWEDENRATAHHEAGHARAAAKAGHRVSRMQIDADHGGVTAFTGDVHDGNMKDHLVAIVAGQEAEIDYLMREHKFSRREAERHTRHGAGGDRKLFAEAAEGTGYTWETIQDEARRFVRRHGYTIEQNAKPLARRGRRGGTWA